MSYQTKMILACTLLDRHKVKTMPTPEFNELSPTKFTLGELVIKYYDEMKDTLCE